MRLEQSETIRLVRNSESVDGNLTSRATFGIGGIGGIGWRTGVPHIVVMAGDVAPCAPMRQKAYEDYWFQPVSERGNAVPVAALRAHIEDDTWSEPGQFGYEEYTYVDRGGGDYDVIREWVPRPEDEKVIDWGNGNVRYGHIHYERSGLAGDPMVAPPNAATVEDALEAMDKLDIAVVSLAFLGQGDPGPGPLDRGERTVDEIAEYLAMDRESVDAGYDYRLTELMELCGYDGWGSCSYATGINFSAISHLTGAVQEDGRAMCYSMSRFGQNTDGYAQMATFLVGKLKDLAGTLGNANTFDIAFTIDNTGSFSSGTGPAAQMFAALVGALRDDGADIYVGLSRFSDYSYYTLPWAGDGWDCLPFTLQLPVKSVRDDDDYDRLVEELSVLPPGGGGDSPETQWEAFYQLATGVGFDGSVRNESVLDSGFVAMPGYYQEYDYNLREYVWKGNKEDLELVLQYHGLTEQERNQYLAFPPRSQGSGYMDPGRSGDVPPAVGGTLKPRGQAQAGPNEVRIERYEPG